MQLKNLGKVAIVLFLAAFIVWLCWDIARIGQPNRPNLLPENNSHVVRDIGEVPAIHTQELNPNEPSKSSPTITEFRKELGVRQEDFHKLIYEDHVLWPGYDRNSAHQIAFFIKPDPDVEVGENYDIYPVDEYAGQSPKTVSISFNEASRNIIAISSIGTKQAAHHKLAEPEEGWVLFGHEYKFRWWDTKGPAGEIRFRTPDGPEEGVKDYSMDLVLPATALYPKRDQ